MFVPSAWVGTAQARPYLASLRRPRPARLPLAGRAAAAERPQAETALEAVGEIPSAESAEAQVSKRPKKFRRTKKDGAGNGTECQGGSSSEEDVSSAFKPDGSSSGCSSSSSGSHTAAASGNSGPGQLAGSAAASTPQSTRSTSNSKPPADTTPLHRISGSQPTRPADEREPAAAATGGSAPLKSSEAAETRPVRRRQQHGQRGDGSADEEHCAAPSDGHKGPKKSSGREPFGAQAAQGRATRHTTDGNADAPDLAQESAAAAATPPEPSGAASTAHPLRSGWLAWLLSPLTRLAAWLAGAVLAVYRLLPYAFRSLFYSSQAWPPQLAEPHVSPSMSLLLASKGSLGRAVLRAAGFTREGRAVRPLHDVPRWRVEQLVGCGVRDMSLYRSALTHVTALPPERRAASYERLEFLGDSVAELVSRSVLMERLPQADEGQLTMLSQTVVAGSRMSEYAAWLGLERWVLKNAYAVRDKQHGPGILGDAFEALLGAIFLDAGLRAARAFFLRVLAASQGDAWLVLNDPTDFKGALSSLAAAAQAPQPVYQAKLATKPFGNSGTRRKYWSVKVSYEAVVGTGRSFERCGAEQAAARQALMALRVIDCYKGET